MAEEPLERTFDIIYDEATRVAPILAKRGELKSACYTTESGVWVDISERKDFAYLEKGGVGIFISPVGRRKKGGVRPKVLEVSVEVSQLLGDSRSNLEAYLGLEAESFREEYGLEGELSFGYENPLQGDDASPFKITLPEKSKYSALAARRLLSAVGDFADRTGLKAGYSAISD